MASLKLRLIMYNPDGPNGLSMLDSSSIQRFSANILKIEILSTRGRCGAALTEVYHPVEWGHFARDGFGGSTSDGRPSSSRNL